MSAENPQHYNQGIGPLEIIERLQIEWTNTVEPVCLWSVLKYIIRCKFKGTQLDDLKKARVYLDKWIEAIEKQTNEFDKPE